MALEFQSILILTGLILVMASLYSSGGFVFVNSIAGLVGYLSNGQALPSFSLYFLIAALLGAILGATLGSRMINSSSIRKLLGVVLVIAGSKLIFTSL